MQAAETWAFSINTRKFARADTKRRNINLLARRSESGCVVFVAQGGNGICTYFALLECVLGLIN